MKRVTAAMIAILPIFGCSRAVEQDPVLLELARLPVGIEVTHTPPEVIGPAKGRNTGWPYYWQFKTEVRSLRKRLTIEKFGIIAWDGDKWVLPKNQERWNCGVLDGNTFAEWYGATGGVLEPGTVAVDPQNWAGSKVRKSFRQKWFFIAIDDKNRKWKGEGVVHLKLQN